MSDELPDTFDLIVVGTGLTEAIIAAAASRVGKKVLHVDSNDYYGDLWASFNLDNFQKFIKRCNDTTKQPDTSIPLTNGENLKETNNTSIINDIKEKWYIPSTDKVLLPETLQQSEFDQTENADPNATGKLQETNTINEENISCCASVVSAVPVQQSLQWTQEKICNDYRKFNIDLAPKLLYSRGALVELLISSNIARYAEFRNVSRVLTWLSESLQEVPCSRADVFATKQVRIVEKRMLMRLLTDIMNDEKTWSEFEHQTFAEFLKTYRLSSNIIYYVLYTMASSTQETSFGEGLERLQKFLRSLGRYGNTPFLWTMYGSGELPQCFCRFDINRILCAVFGGTYCLNRPITAVVLDENNLCKAVCIGKQKICAEHIVMSIGKAPKEFLPNEMEYSKISHAVFLISKSIKNADKENLTYIRFPPLFGKFPCNVIEVGPAAGACPNDFYLLHLYVKQEKTPEEDLAPFVNKLVNTNDYKAPTSQSTQANNTTELPLAIDALPQALWSVYFTIPDFSETDLDQNIPKNMFLCAGPDAEIDFEFAVRQAKDIFTKIYPADDFLPRAPDPEEVVLDGDEGTEEEPNNINDAAETLNDNNTETVNAITETLEN